MTTTKALTLYAADVVGIIETETADGWTVAHLLPFVDPDRFLVVLERDAGRTLDPDAEGRYHLALESHPRGRTVVAITDAGETIARITGVLDRVDMDRLVAFVEHANAHDATVDVLDAVHRATATLTEET
jgi:antitoxin (DNA-binding transcriptional repressor) of toxin-antitoxin stability system